MPADRRTVLVTDAGRGSAIAVIRSLGRRGWSVVAADSTRRSPGFRSRHTSARVLHPDSERRPAEAAQLLLAAVDRFGVDLVVPVTDEAMLSLAAVRPELDRRAVVALPDEHAVEVTADKAATYELATRLGIPVPRSVPIASDVEPAELGAELGWPVVIKPRRSRTLTAQGTIARHAVFYASTVAALEGARHGPPSLAQEYVAGEGHGIELLLQRGEVIAAFQHRRLREVPITGGASSYRESVALDPLLLDCAAALLGALDWTGLAMVEFRVGPAGPRLMEVNGRIWGSLPLAVRAGVDFPSLMADVHLGRRVQPRRLGSYAVGVRSRSLPLEVSWIGAVLAGRGAPPGLKVPGRLEALKVAAQLLVPTGWDVLSAEDPVPGLLEITRVVSGSFARLRTGAGHQ